MGGNVRGVGILHSFWGLQGIMDRNRPLDNWGLNFVVHVDGDFGSAQEWEFWES